jgi:predicted acylesterase/phospholipase RssA
MSVKVPMIVVTSLLAACGPLQSRLPIDPALHETAVVPGFETVRIYADASAAAFDAFPATQHVNPGPNGRLDMLALSGGAENGAFGAGFLVGWSERGGRPDFDVVTGVSVGALIAPLAFLGPSRDAQLAKMTTDLRPQDVLRPRILAGLLFADSFADTSPLRRTIEEYVTPDLLADIAHENAKGRILIVVTTNIDAQRSVLWDMGAIAAVGTPEAAELFRDVLLASASIPGAFEPVYIDALSGKAPVREMHVDGAASNQILMVPEGLLVGGVVDQSSTDIYAIVNNRLEPEPDTVRPRPVPLLQRGLSTVLKSALRQQIATMRVLDADTLFRFRATAIGPDFTVPLGRPFDPSYTRPLFDYGRAVGKQLNPWLVP